MGGLNTLMINLGWLMGNCLGLLVPVQYFSLALCIPSVLFLPVCWLLVESPIWLLRRNNKQQAIEVRVLHSHWSRERVPARYCPLFGGALLL